MVLDVAVAAKAFECLDDDGGNALANPVLANWRTDWPIKRSASLSSSRSSA